MSNGQAKNRHRVRKALKGVLVTLLCLSLLLVLVLKIYLSTSSPRIQLSRLLSAQLQQKVTVSGIATSGDTLLLRGITLANPPGFQGENLASVQNLAVAPNWGALLLGRRNFRRIELEGVRLTLEKNGKGVWNFAQLQQLLAAQKPSPKETFIGRFLVQEGSLLVNGQELGRGSLRVSNLTAKGSLASAIDLSAQDAQGNRYRLTGSVQPGKEPALDLSLSAPALSLKRLAYLARLKDPRITEQGRGSLKLDASLHRGMVKATGAFVFDRIRAPLAQGSLPLAGRLSTMVEYDIGQDRARIRQAALTLNDAVTLSATASIASVKKNRNFDASVTMAPTDLAALSVLLPEKERTRTALGGSVSVPTLKLTGSAGEGLTGAAGSLRLNGGWLTRDGRLLFDALGGDAQLFRRTGGFNATGRVRQGPSSRHGVVEHLDAPFAVELSPHFKPVRAEIPQLLATALGFPLQGRLAFDAAGGGGLAAHLGVAQTEAASLNPFLKKFDLQFAAGHATLVADVVGRSLKDLDLTAKARFSGIKGSRGGNKLAAQSAVVDARLGRRGQWTAATGDVQFSGVALDGKSADAGFAFGYADGQLQLERVRSQVEGVSLAIARVVARVPVKESRPDGVRYPLFLDASGCSIKRGDAAVEGLSGSVRGGYNAGPGGKWLDGTAELAAGALWWQKKVVGAPSIRLAFSRAGGRGELKGPLLGGRGTGEFSFDPFQSKVRGGDYHLVLQDVLLPSVEALLPKREGFRLSEGRLDAELKGSYRGDQGLEGAFEASGKGMALTGAGGKALLSGAEIGLKGTLDRDRLSLSHAQFSAGPGVTLKLKGEMAEPLTPRRKGKFTFNLAEASVNTLFDRFINVLPRFLQEATVAGALAAEGGVTVAGGKKMLDGSLTLKRVRLEAPSQKFIVGDINGSVPLSLDLSGETAAKKPSATSFSRANYPELLKQLRTAATGPATVSVDQVGFGTLQLGSLALRLRAVNGSTEITSLTTTLYEGALLGRGVLSMQQGLSYRGDLLVNDVSLKALCGSIPGLKGYISGRVDGVISLAGAGKGIPGMVGFTDLWARKGRGEKMLVSKEFLQRLSKQKISGFFFSTDRPYDQAEITATLQEGFLTFDKLSIMHTNLLRVRDLNVSIAPTQNRIELTHLLNAIRQAAERGKGAAAPEAPAQAPAAPEFKWEE